MTVDRDEPAIPEAFWQTLRRDEPDPRAIERAYRRFAARPKPKRSSSVLSSWLAAGFVLGLGVAFAASGTELFRTGAPSGGAATTGVASPAKPPRVSGRSRAQALASASTNAVSPEPPSSGRATPSPARVRDSVALSGAVKIRAERDAKWQRVAQALAAHDYSDAERALVGLESGGSPDDREAAALALAQVLMARGRPEEARARLERLGSTARSDYVRRTASSLLGEIVGSDRSAPTPSATQ